MKKLLMLLVLLMSVGAQALGSESQVMGAGSNQVAGLGSEYGVI